METIILTLAVYCLVKYIRYINDKAFKDGYSAYQEELERESQEIYERIKRDETILPKWTNNDI
jgi:hypothetical protein